MAVCNISDILSFLSQGQCLLGVDYGRVAIGIAVGDPAHRVASPLATILRKKFSQDVLALAQIIRERNVGGLIVGLPKNMDGSEGPTAQSARTFVSNVLKAEGIKELNLLVAFWDERLSTAAVERLLIHDDMSRKRRDMVVDKAASSYILQGALDFLSRKSN